MTPIPVLNPIPVLKEGSPVMPSPVMSYPAVAKSAVKPLTHPCASVMVVATKRDRFYSELPLLEQFIDITVPENFVPVPEDWYLVVTDIVQSTLAIGQGQYKAVNFMGAAAIIGIINLDRRLELPFVFGGDGATVAIPGYLVAPARPVLLALQAMAQADFGLTLRTGIVPVPAVTARYPLEIAKVKVSPNYSQAVFRGGGLTYATQLIKDPATQTHYQVTPDLGQGSGPDGAAAITQTQADLTGLECRWQDIPSPHGEIATLIVVATPTGTAPATGLEEHVYRDVITTIESIYGQGDRLNPVQPESLHLSLQWQHLALETKARAQGRSPWSRWLYLLKIRLENLLGMTLMALGLKFKGIHWQFFRTLVAADTDHRKFDDMLRMVISGTPQQHRQLKQFLERCYKAGTLAYGMHLSSNALMTCLVFERSGQQVHFIDGADGGYALAARILKHRLKS